jgi:hypothetical protein
VTRHALLPSQRAAILLARLVPGHRARVMNQIHELDLETAFHAIDRLRAEVNALHGWAAEQIVAEHPEILDAVRLAAIAADAPKPIDDATAAADADALAGYDEGLPAWADLAGLYQDGQS